MEYLTFLFDNGNKYQTINLERSAVSVFNEYVNGLPVGKHPQIWFLVYAGLYSSTKWPPFTKGQTSILNWVLKLNPLNQKIKKQ